MSEMLKAHWFQILLALSGADMHGSAIMEEVLEQTDGAMGLWPATLYGSLRDLEERGWIREVPPGPDDPPEPGRRRVHALTLRGREALRAELVRMRRMLDVARGRDLLAEPGSAQ